MSRRKDIVPDVIQNMLAKVKVQEEAKEYASFDQYMTLAKLLEERGVMPNDLATLCSLLYKRQYARLSRDQASDLMKRIADVPAEQIAMRHWISNTVSILNGTWVRGETEA
jgi:hypothetical protein